LTVNKRGGSSQLPTRQVARLEQFRAKRATSCLDALRKSHYAGPQAAKTSRKSGIIGRWYSNDMNDHADPGLLRIAPIHARQRIPGHTAKRTIEKASRDARMQTPVHTGFEIVIEAPIAEQPKPCGGYSVKPSAPHASKRRLSLSRPRDSCRSCKVRPSFAPWPRSRR